MPIKIINFDDYIDDSLKLKSLNENPLTVQHPGRVLLIGPSGRGKSNLLLNLLLNKDTRMTYNRVYMIVRDLTEDKNNYLVQYYKRLEAQIKKETGEEIKLFTITDKLSDIPDLDNEVNKDLQNIIIFDDLINEDHKNQKPIMEYYTRSRKRNVTPIYLSQSFFRVPKTIRMNVDYYFFFDVPSRRELTNLFVDFGQDFVDQRMFNQVVRESTRGHGFLIIDKNSKNPLMKYRRGFDEGWELPDPSDDGPRKKPILKPVVL